MEECACNKMLLLPQLLLLLLLQVHRGPRVLLVSKEMKERKETLAHKVREMQRHK